MVSSLSDLREWPIRCHPQRVRLVAWQRGAGDAEGNWGTGWGLRAGPGGAGGRPRATLDARRLPYKLGLCDPG